MKDLWRILYSAKVQAVRLWVEISNLNKIEKIERMSIEYFYHRYACKFFFLYFFSFRANCYFSFLSQSRKTHSKKRVLRIPSEVLEERIDDGNID